MDQTLNPRVASLKVSKTAQLTEAAREMKAQGIPVIELAAGEPDFDTPAPIVQVQLSSGQKHTCIYRKMRISKAKSCSVYSQHLQTCVSILFNLCFVCVLS